MPALFIPNPRWDGVKGPPLALNPMLLACFVEYDQLVMPYVEAVRAVLTGQRARYKFSFEDAVLVFDHGCLMSRVWHNGMLYALPPIGLNSQQMPVMQGLAPHQAHWLTEFLTLPKSVKLFVFTLLREVFERRPLLYGMIESEHSKLGLGVESIMNSECKNVTALPAEFQAVLAEVAWTLHSNSV